MTQNSDPDKYKCSGYGTGFDACGSFSLSDSSGSGFGINVTTFSANMSSLVHIDIKKNKILILGKRPADGLDDTTLTGQEEYSINFTEQ